MKKFFAVILSVTLIFTSFCTVCSASFAPAGTTGSFSAFCYNVAGLPDIGFITGTESKDVLANQVAIGKWVESNKYDIFATQEDFGYHDNLIAQLTGYTYQTQHHGGVPYGDGTNIFTRTFPLYGEKHITWNSLYGIADDGADQFSQKGITYCCIKIADGVFVDFYNIHADAYNDEGSLNARKDNFNQLRDIINGREVDRPVIVTGDFNEYVFDDCTNLREALIEGAGLKDAWVEVCNYGDYDDCSHFMETMGASWNQKWGRWDSVERFMYKDGGGISLFCDSFEYINVLNNSGKSCSDHYAAHAEFSYTVNTDASADEEEFTSGKTSGFEELFRRVVAFFKALYLAVTNFDKIKDYIGI